MFQTDEEIDQFLDAFEKRTISKAQWTHKAHVAVAGAYVWRDPETAVLALRLGILLLNEEHRTINSADSGYHETLTVFWVSIIREFCRRRDTCTRLEVINEMVKALPAGLFRDYYGFDVVRSRLARERWVEPDLRPLTLD